MRQKLTLLLTAFLLLTGMSLRAQIRTEVTDVLDREFTGVTGTSYQEWSDKTSNSDAVYAGQSAGGNGSIQLRSNNNNSGIITTTSGGTVTHVEVTWNSNTATGRTLNVYGSNTAYTSPTELYDASTQGTLIGTIVCGTSTELVITDSYPYIGLRSANAAMYLEEIDITWSTGGATPNPSIAASNVEIGYNATSGSIEYSINNPVSGGVLTANTTSDWLSLGTVGSTVPFTCSANDLSAARNASVTLTYTYNTDQTVTKNVTVTQSGNPNVLNNISDITTTGSYTVQGTIVAKSSRGFIVGDGTGYIYYYNTNYPQDSYVIGDMVRLSGNVVAYGGVFEFNNSTTITTATTSNYVAEEPTVITGAEMDSRVASTTPTQLSTYVQYVGTLSVNGTHYNITDIEGATTAQGSVSYPLSTDFASLDGQEVTVKGYFVGISSSTYYNTMLGSIEENAAINPQLTVSPTQLNGFQYTYGAGPSQAMSFIVSGSDLSSNVSVVAPQDFEVSINADGPFSDNISLSHIAGVVDATSIFVRMKSGLTVGSYSGDVILTSGTLTSTVTLSGMVLEDLSPVLTATPTSLDGFTYDFEQGGPSDLASFLIGGNNLLDNVTIYPSESFEVSTLPGILFRPENPAIIYIPNSGHFYDISIYVRMKAGLESGTYSEQIYAVTQDADTLFINVSGTVTGGTPTPPDPPTPGDGNYVRISDLSQLTEGAYVVFAARFDGNATDYYAMSNASSGKPTGVLFTSATADENEVLPASIVDEESNYYWTVGVTANGYTFTNADNELIGYTSSTNFATGGDNTEWAITIQTSEEGAMVPNYTGFVVGNVNNAIRAFALNNNHNFGPYHTQNMGGSNYNFYLDIFVKTEGGNPPTPTVATPTFTPAAGTYYEAQTVSIACATEGATIRYTLDGTNPTESSPVYSSPLSIETTTTVKAIAMKEGYENSAVAEATYTIQLGVVTIFNQDWEGEMNGWTFVDVEGEAIWSISQTSGNHYAKINAYNQGANIDWCISPAFNLNAYSNPVLSFRTAKNYTGNDLEIFFSNDYDGEDPTNSIWTPLTCALSQGSWTWVESGDIDLSSFSGTECYIGFMYTSTETEAAGWEVDDILLVGNTSESVVTVTPLTLTGFTYVEGNGPSAEQSFTVSGLNLTNNITISDASDFEISLTSGNNFTAQSTITLTVVGGNVEETTIYVRMKAGLAVGDYNGEDITVSCSDVDDIDVACSGSVTEQPAPGGDYVRISDVNQLVAGNRIILAARYNETNNAYFAVANTLTSSKLSTTEFTSAMNGSSEIVPADIMADEDSYYWTIDLTSDGYTFTNANGQVLSYGSGTNFNFTGSNTAWTIENGTSDPASLVPQYYGLSITNVNTSNRGMALRVTDANSVVGAYSVSNMSNGEYNFFLDIFMQGEGGTCTVAAPTFNPEGGTYYEPQEVTISCATEGATIWYSLISWNGPWTPYTEAITVEEFASFWAYAEKEGCNDSPVVNADYIIQNDLTIIFWQEWEDDWDPWHGWTERCTMGDSLWRVASYGGNHYAYANGYNHPQTIDWLISPAFDLDSYDDVVLTFNTAKNYNGPDLEVFFSNDYDGENPDDATWISLPCELSEGGWNWVASGDISLDEFSGSNCYIGFKYTSDEDAAGWEVDDIKLASGSTSPTPTLIATPNYLGDFSYVVGNGPSESQNYILSGVNLHDEGYIHIVSCSWYEISLDNETFTEVLEFPCTDLPATVYVRMMEGLAPNTYDGVYIANEYYDDINYAAVVVNVSGIVHYENDPSILWDDLPYYIQGNNGSNNNRVPVATYVWLGNLEPHTTYRYTNQFVDENDGPETAGAGNVIYANLDGFYRSTSPSLATEGGYGEFTTSWDGDAHVWFVNEPTANARFTPGNYVYLRIRLNDGHDGTTVAHTLTTQRYATVINFGTEHDANQGSAFYVKSNENPMTFAQMYINQNPNEHPIFATIVETTGVDFGNINQYADFYKEEVAGKDGWFGGILPNDNEYGINKIMVYDITHYWYQEYRTTEYNGQWYPNANTVNPTNGLDEPIFIDLTEDGVEESVEANVKVWSTDHEFVIENGDDAPYTMTVYNVLGQSMMQRQINAGSTERISHSLAEGLYIISLQNSQNKAAIKVIVK